MKRTKGTRKEERGEWEKEGPGKWRGTREGKMERTPRLKTFIESLRRKKSASIQISHNLGSADGMNVLEVAFVIHIPLLTRME